MNDFTQTQTFLLRQEAQANLDNLVNNLQTIQTLLQEGQSPRIENIIKESICLIENIMPNLAFDNALKLTYLVRFLVNCLLDLETITSDTDKINQTIQEITIWHDTLITIFQSN
ncbi:hypothetical protein [Nostoc sp. UIC 10630]|uniref:hypothetical protein n=1 Tax=Nostoc sp. UIC 10630 TaxID=2100146 RepID=UPI0013D3FBB3|nr:hypothetical protein [Nostoc sp. UIC 10630]NEU77576.1 hypothetical protein [Nostoc sp. UIC 10630]